MNTEWNNVTADEWAEYYGIDTGAAFPTPTEADEEYERFTEERDAWLLDEDEEPGVACDACGGPVDGADGATDDVIVLCGSFYGRGCADMPGAFEYA